MSPPRFSGIFYPRDLDLLQRVFVRLCAERGIRPDDADAAETLALQLVALCNSGISEETALLAAARRNDREPFDRAEAG